MGRDLPLLQPTGPGSGPTVYYQGRYLYSSRRPHEGPDRLAADTPLPPDTLILIPSFGLGYGLPTLLGRLPPGCHVLCVEHDAALWDTSAEARHALEGAVGLTLLFAEDVKPVKTFLDSRTPGEFRRVLSIPLCAAARITPEFYRDAEAFLAGAIQTFWQNRMTILHMGRLFVKNMFANIALLPRARDLGGLKTDRPVIAVGAGPSLTPRLSWLRRLRPRAALLAVDTAVPVLLGSGLVPDFVVALEPQFINIKDFIGLPAGSISLLADIASAPQAVRFCLEARRCPLYFFSSEFHPLSLWRRLECSSLRPLPVPPLGSVGVTAVYAALLITSHPVYLCGFDFGYTGRRTHAAGSPASLSDLATAGRARPAGQAEFASLAGRPRVTLTGKKGARIESDLVLSSYAKNLEALVTAHRRVYDLSPSGLDLGARLLESEADVLKAIPERPDALPLWTEAVAPAAWNADRIVGFLEEERRLLEASDKVWSELVGPDLPERGTLDGAQSETVALTEHAHFHVAGKTALPGYTRSYAAQALIEGRILAERIRRAARLLH